MRGNVGLFCSLARNCLASTLDCIVMEMRKINREKGYSAPLSDYQNVISTISDVVIVQLGFVQ